MGWGVTISKEERHASAPSPSLGVRGHPRPPDRHGRPRAFNRRCGRDPSVGEARPELPGGSRSSVRARLAAIESVAGSSASTSSTLQPVPGTDVQMNSDCDRRCRRTRPRSRSIRIQPSERGRGGQRLLRRRLLDRPHDRRRGHLDERVQGPQALAGQPVDRRSAVLRRRPRRSSTAAAIRPSTYRRCATRRRTRAPRSRCGARRTAAPRGPTQLMPQRRSPTSRRTGRSTDPSSTTRSCSRSTTTNRAPTTVACT